MSLEPQATSFIDQFALLIAEVGDENYTVIRYVNKRLCELSGFSPDELVDQPLDKLIPPISREAHHRFADGYIHRPVTRPMGKRDGEIVLLHNGGYEIRVWVGLSSHPDPEVDAGKRKLSRYVVASIMERDDPVRVLVERRSTPRYS